MAASASCGEFGSTGGKGGTTWPARISIGSMPSGQSSEKGASKPLNTMGLRKQCKKEQEVSA